MSNDGRARENGYRAFISYSHRDDAAAKSLHKRLETYRLPKKLIGQSGERGPIPERLTPIFRDLDELSAADDLTVEIKAALARSATLIVLCSPGAKASKWVNLEIETFRALHGNSRPVLAALIEGEPADAFPPALVADGQEPVAADFRKNRDGKRLALLKLVAGMAGAPLDALVQRDAQRQYRRVMAITGTALTAALAMALLLVVALRAQSEAERQRQEAEGLVEYMLTDLRDKLKGVGRLDVMTAVNERAMGYYGGQEALEGLPAESLERRARILHAMGEDDEKRGSLNLALKKFTEAHRVTLAILALNSKNSSAIFSHAQSEYWLGYIAFSQNKFNLAKFHFLKRRKLIIDEIYNHENDFKWLKEAGYAEGDLCAVIVSNNLKSDDHHKYCINGYLYINRAHSINSDNKSIKQDIVNRLGWLSDYYMLLNNSKKGIYFRNKSFEFIKILAGLYPNDKSILEQIAGYHISMARIYKSTNEKKRMLSHFNFAKKQYLYLKNFDRENSHADLWITYVNKELKYYE